MKNDHFCGKAEDFEIERVAKLMTDVQLPALSNRKRFKRLQLRGVFVGGVLLFSSLAVAQVRLLPAPREAHFVGEVAFPATIAVSVPSEETARRWSLTTPQWPMVHARLNSVSRDQFMARHLANHINIVYASTAEKADQALAVKAAMMQALGMQVHLCGDVNCK